MPPPQVSSVQCQEGTSQLERGPLTRKGREDWATGFSSVWGQCTNVLLWFHSAQTHKAEMYKDGEEQEEKQGLLTAATWWESLQFIMTYSGDKLSRFHHWLNQHAASHLASPEDETSFWTTSIHCIHIHICEFKYSQIHKYLLIQLLESFPTPCPQTPARDQEPQKASSGFWGYVCARCKPRLPWLIPTGGHTLRLTQSLQLSTCMPPIWALPVVSIAVHMSRGKFAAVGKHTDSQDPCNCQWALSWPNPFCLPQPPHTVCVPAPSLCPN